MKNKDVIEGEFDVLIKQKNTEEKSRLFNCDKIEYLHSKQGDFFDHHIMIYRGKKLIFKVWLPNSAKDKEFKSLKEALESVDIELIDFGRRERCGSKVKN
ncbi:hypothetical protein J4462_03700 [Candidatus Pacearchaeota archaeon]|nr:hypothetical protein [Candidatus Pacearchaeota archaeon]